MLKICGKFMGQVSVLTFFCPNMLRQAIQGGPKFVRPFVKESYVLVILVNTKLISNDISDMAAVCCDADLRAIGPF